MLAFLAIALMSNTTGLSNIGYAKWASRDTQDSIKRQFATTKGDER
jgi:hypothetical protein